MEFLTRHSHVVHRRPGGVEILVHKRVDHEDFVETLAEPRRLWDCDGIESDPIRKNEIGRGTLEIGFSKSEVFLKEFPRRSAIDTLLSVFRESRAARSFLAGLEMCTRELPTPMPLAAVSVRRMGLIRGSWLLTDLLPPMPSVRDLSDHPDRHADILSIWPWDQVLAALGRLLRRLTDAHVCHRDLSLRNVLIERPGESPPAEPRLWIIDLNRVLTLSADQWRESHAKTNFERLRLRPEDFDQVLQAYFPGEAELTVKRAAYVAARQRHRLYKRVKQLPRR